MLIENAIEKVSLFSATVQHIRFPVFLLALNIDFIKHKNQFVLWLDHAEIFGN